MNLITEIKTFILHNICSNFTKNVFGENKNQAI